MTSPIDQILTDPVKFISRLKIKDKNGKMITFGKVITKEQIEIIRAIHENDKVVIIKARQMGITTVVRAYAFWQAYTSHLSVNSVVVSNKQRSAEELLKIDKRFFESLPVPLKRAAKINRDRISFETTESNILAMSALAEGSNRGYTLNTVHASEFAFYDHPEEWLASMVASVNDGKIILESTANFFGDSLHKLATSESGWKIIFLPWNRFPTYKKSLRKKGLVLTKEEEILKEQHKLSDEQINWRRSKISEIKDIRLFKREYPLTIEDAYSLSDDAYFTNESFAFTQKIDIGDKRLEVLQPYDPRDSYLVSVDLAGGQGGDYSCAMVLSKLTNAPAAVLYSNIISINEFAEKTMSLANSYRCKIVFEINNHGEAFKEVLNQHRWTQYIAHRTTAQSKISCYDVLRTFLEEGMLSYLDHKTFAELRSLMKDPRGLAPSAAQGYHDDRAMALAIGLFYLKDMRMPKNNFEKWMKKQSRTGLGTKITTANPLRNNNIMRR